MQQRQLRLGDILDDYCPRERRVTNHAVVAMVGPDVKQTRCTTCDTEHEFKHARVPRQRKKVPPPAALGAPAPSSGPKRVAHEQAGEGPTPNGGGTSAEPDSKAAAAPAAPENESDAALDDDGAAESGNGSLVEDGPVHRPLIRATLPRPEGQPPPARPAPEFTIRQPGGRPGRFRPRHQRGTPFPGNRSGNMAGGGLPRAVSGRMPMVRSGKRHGNGRKRSK